MEMFNDLEFESIREITRDGNTIVFYRKDDGKYSFSMKDDAMLDCIVHANIDKDMVSYSEIECLCDIIFDKIKSGELELTDDLKCYDAIDLL